MVSRLDPKQTLPHASASLQRSSPFVEHNQPAGRALPGSAVGARVAVGHHRDRSIHTGPTIAVTMLETRVLLTKDAEIGVVDHLGLHQPGADTDGIEQTF